MSAQEWLDHADTLREAAERETWGEYLASPPTESAGVRHAQFREQAYPAAIAALRAVLDLHTAVRWRWGGRIVCDICQDLDGYATGWPCPTVTTINETLGEA